MFLCLQNEYLIQTTHNPQCLSPLGEKQESFIVIATTADSLHTIHRQPTLRFLQIYFVIYRNIAACNKYPYIVLSR